MRVRPVETSGDLDAFIDLPYRLHAGDELWAPPFRRDVSSRLSRDENPFFEHGEARYYLAEEDGAVLGRIAAIANHLHNQVHGERTGFFGFFECHDREEAARALLGAAEQWARERDFTVVRGPTSFSVNDECGLLVAGFDRPPTLMMPHNPPYYERLVTASGFAKAKDLLVYERGSMNSHPRLPERLERAAEIVRRRLGVTLRPLSMKDFVAEVRRIRELYNACWERNWGHVPMTEKEIDHLAEQLAPVVLPDLMPVAEIDGSPVGFGIAIPDVNQVLRSNRAGRLFPAVLRVLWALKARRLRRCRILLLGVLPRYRGMGIDALLYRWIWTHAAERRIHWGEAGWILEDNTVMRAGLEKMGFVQYKTYRLYEKPL